jgi:hypothetical protein
MTRYLLLFDSYGLVFCGAPSLTRGRICLLYVVLALSSPLGLATIYYCLGSETSFFVASYDSQGHDGGIWPRLQTGLTISNPSPSHIATDGQLVSQPWCRAQSGAHDQIFITVWQFRSIVYCCREVLTATLQNSGHGSNRTENAVYCVCSAEKCLMVSYLAMLCPSTLHYTWIFTTLTSTSLYEYK